MVMGMWLMGKKLFVYTLSIKEIKTMFEHGDDYKSIVPNYPTNHFPVGDKFTVSMEGLNDEPMTFLGTEHGLLKFENKHGAIIGISPHKINFIMTSKNRKDEKTPTKKNTKKSKSLGKFQL